MSQPSGRDQTLVAQLVSPLGIDDAQQLAHACDQRHLAELAACSQMLVRALISGSQRVSLRVLLLDERVQELNLESLEVGDVTRHDRKPMNPRRRRDHCILIKRV